jgi:BMFP domain-containing protein YqiC|tara:strand:+ start:604 stop:843 length:240 start_codon:yes stop_codon:yes gene_type:complete
MNNSEKVLKLISSFLENGILTSKDAKKEILTNLKFQRDNFIDKLKIVPREEFEILKKIINKQEKEIKELKKNKRSKKAK